MRCTSGASTFSLNKYIPGIMAHCIYELFVFAFVFVPPKRRVLRSLSAFVVVVQAGIPGSAVCLHPGAVQTDLARYITNGADGGDVRLSETPPPEGGVFGKLVKGALDKVILPIDRGANTQVSPFFRRLPSFQTCRFLACYDQG